MDQSRFLSFLLSLCLHAGIFAAALFWPAGSRPLVNLNATVIEVTQYTIGAPGARATAPKPAEKPAAPQAKPETPQVPETKPDPPKAPEKPLKAPEKPEVKPEAPKAPEKPIAVKKEDAPKPANATKPVAAAPKKPAEKPEDAIKKALGDIGKGQPAAKPSGRAPSAGSVADALGAFKKAGAGDGDTGTGPGGSGGDGVGILGTYQQSLVSRIRPFWEYAGRADRKNPMAIARIRIAKDGTIQGATIEKSSGDAAFDGSVLKAIQDTGKVEAPPTPQLMDITLGFAYESLAAGS